MIIVGARTPLRGPAEKLILRDGVWACVRCGEWLETQDEDEDGRPIAWVTHKPDCRDAGRT